MAEPFLAELRLFSFSFAPKGWAMCNGQFLPINQNQALFSLLGTTYGGNGQTTFALPDLRARVPIGVGSGHTLGEKAGASSVTLSIQQMPQHLHLVGANSGNATTDIAGGNVLGSFSNGYLGSGPLQNLQPASVSTVGGSQAHENRQPFLTLNYCIALQGIFPSPN